MKVVARQNARSHSIGTRARCWAARTERLPACNGSRAGAREVGQPLQSCPHQFPSVMARRSAACCSRPKPMYSMNRCMPPYRSLRYCRGVGIGGGMAEKVERWVQQRNAHGGAASSRHLESQATAKRAQLIAIKIVRTHVHARPASPTCMRPRMASGGAAANTSWSMPARSSSFSMPPSATSCTPSELR